MRILQDVESSALENSQSEKEEKERYLEDEMVDAFQQELRERILEENNEEEDRSLDTYQFDTEEEERALEKEFADALEQELMARIYQDQNKQVQLEMERQISADLDLTPPKQESVRQVVRPPPPDSFEGRPTTPLRLGSLIIRPVITRRCLAPGKQSFRKHCAKYLECGEKKYRGAIRTCESGQLYDVELRKCNDAQSVDCNLTD